MIDVQYTTNSTKCFKSALRKRAIEKRGSKTAPLGSQTGAVLKNGATLEGGAVLAPYNKVAPKRGPKRPCFTDDQMAPQGSRFGATYFFECNIAPFLSCQ